MSTTGFQFVPARLNVVAANYANFAGPWPEEPGIRLSVIVSAEDYLVTGVWTNTEHSDLYTLTDDTGRDLLELGGGASAVGAATDGQGALFEIQCMVPPTPTASKISADGQLLVSTASGTETHKSAVVSLQVGSKATVADFEFNVASVESSEYDDGKEIEFKRSTTEQRMRGVSQIRFEDGAGNQLEVEHSTSSSHGIDGDLEVTDRFLFPTESDAFIIVVELWVDRVETHVEYALSCKIGCGT